MYPNVKNYPVFKQSPYKVPILSEIAEAGNDFYPLIIGVPKANSIVDLVHGAGITKRYTVQLAPGSLIVGTTGYSSQPSGFNYTIIDQGTKLATASRVHSSNLGSWNDPSYSPNNDTAVSGISYFTQPIIVVNPGLLSVEITNLATVSANLQLTLWCHIAINDINLGRIEVK